MTPLPSASHLGPLTDPVANCLEHVWLSCQSQSPGDCMTECSYESYREKSALPHFLKNIYLFFNGITDLCGSEWPCGKS